MSKDVYQHHSLLEVLKRFKDLGCLEHALEEFLGQINEVIIHHSEPFPDVGHVTTKKHLLNEIGGFRYDLVELALSEANLVLG